MSEEEHEQPSESATTLTDLRIDKEHVGRRRWGPRRIIPLVALLLVALLGLAYVWTRPPEVAVTQVREARAGEAETDLSATGYVKSRRRSVVASGDGVVAAASVISSASGVGVSTAACSQLRSAPIASCGVGVSSGSASSS